MRVTWSRRWPALFESHPVPWQVQTTTEYADTGEHQSRQIIDAELNVVITFTDADDLLFYQLWSLYLYAIPPLSISSLRSRLPENIARRWPQVLQSHQLPWRLDDWVWISSRHSSRYTVMDSMQWCIANGGAELLPALQLLMELSELAGDMHYRHSRGLLVFRLTRGAHETDVTQEAVACTV
jgi:hypothetical protein